MTLKQLYNMDINIQKYFREKSGTNRNEINSILYSYDYQAGSYTEQYYDEEIVEDLYIVNGKKVNLTTRQFTELCGRYIAVKLNMLHPQNVLEVGIGEATNLCDIILNCVGGGKNTVYRHRTILIKVTVCPKICK